MLERSLRCIAIVLSLFIATGFVLFAIDDIDRASTSTQSRIADYTAVSPSPAGERERARRHGVVREKIDDVNDVLLKPFAGIARNAGSRWVQHGVPTLLGLLVYGFLLAFLARFSKGREPVRRPAVSGPAKRAGA